VTHEKGLALRFDNVAPWKRHARIEREYTSQRAMKPSIRANAARGGVASKVVIRGALTYMLWSDFMELSSQPAYKKGAAKPSRPNLYVIAGNLPVFLPRLEALLLGGELSEKGGLLEKLVEQYDSMQQGSREHVDGVRNEVNLWMG
jgi:hypothetical protein